MMPKERTKKEIKTTLWIICEEYEARRIILKLSKEEATKKTLETYNDFRDWVYFKGDFS